MEGRLENRYDHQSEKASKTTRPFRKKEDTLTYEKKDELFIWGRHPIESFLGETARHNDISQVILHVIVDKLGKVPAQLKNIVEICKVLNIPMKAHTSTEDPWPLDESITNHQRVCLKVPSLPLLEIHDITKIVEEEDLLSKTGCVGIILDSIQDPGNMGAILRSAGFFGISFAIFAKDRQASITSSVLRTSAGGAFLVKTAEVTNISRAMEILKEKGLWLIGASVGENTIPYHEIPKDRPYVIVLGNEHKGLRQEIMKRCDYLGRIPGGTPLLDSLNVSVASGILLGHFACPSS